MAVVGGGVDRIMFRDRTDAGRRLAQLLLPFKHRQPLILALPRGGVPVAVEVARALEAPLDLLMVRKIGAPGHSELAIGAVLDGLDPDVFIDHAMVGALHVPESYIEAEIARQRHQIERQQLLYATGRPRSDARNRTVILVDDGVATGATVRVALRGLRQAGAQYTIVAAPVAPADTAQSLKEECDETVFVATPDDFGAVSMYYEDFSEVTDADVIRLLGQMPAPIS